MSISFHGTQECVLTFEAGAATAGELAMMGGNNKVKDGTQGTFPIGKTIHVRNGLAAVQVKGYMEVTYSGSAPFLGYTQLVCDGDGGLKVAASGTIFLVVAVDTTNKILSLYL